MHHDDPADMSIDDRLEELAELLGAGIPAAQAAAGARSGCRALEIGSQHVTLVADKDN